MRFISPAACALAAAAAVFAQVSVDESSTHAHQVNGKTSVTVSLRNSSGKSLHAEGDSAGALDISRFMQAGRTNRVSIAASDSRTLQLQLNAAWYEPWTEDRPAQDLVLQAHYSTTQAAVQQPVTCDVLVSRDSFPGRGMMIAEIGLPPGVEVDRGTLEDILADPWSGVDSFEVAPDHVTFYIWPQTSQSRFHFIFRPRFAMKARAAPSVLYDYYNPDERMVLPPQIFTSVAP